MITERITMAPAELAEKCADADFLRGMSQSVARRLMDMDVESLCAAASGECTAGRADALSERTGEVHGHDRNQQEPGIAPVCGDQTTH